MDIELAVRCDRCSEPFSSYSQPPYSGSCTHSQCEDCVQKDTKCPVRTCCSSNAFKTPVKNWLAIEYLEIIDKENQKITSVKKAIDEKTSTLPSNPIEPTAMPRPKRTTFVAPPQRRSLNERNRTYGIIITNLPPITEEMLKSRFDPGIVSYQLCKDFDGEPSGQAFVRYETREEAENAVRQHNTTSISVNTSIYIGSLPANIDKIDLENLFGICGVIRTSKIIKYYDHKVGDRAYAFIEYESSDAAAKVISFNKTPYEGYRLYVYYAASQKYRAFFGGIPSTVSKKDIILTLRGLFGNRFYEEIYKPESMGSLGYATVDFKDDDARRQCLAMDNIPFSTERPQIKEANQRVSIYQPEDLVEVVILRIPEGISPAEIESMFKLCRPGAVTLLETENYYTCAFTTMPRSGYETAKAFHNYNITWKTMVNYPAPIKIKSKEDYEKENDWEEYQHCLLLRNFDPNWHLREIEKIFFKSFGPDSVYLKRRQHVRDSLYVNVREERDAEKILAARNVYMGGGEAATFERFCEGAQPSDNVPSPVSLSRPGAIDGLVQPLVNEKTCNNKIYYK